MKKIKMMTLLVSGLFIFAACGGEKKAETTDIKEEVVENIKITDGIAEKEVIKDPKKVVVFDMGMLDTLDTLGLGDRVVGVPVENLPDYLSSYDQLDSAGGIKEPDLEKINELQPDLIIISGRQEDAIDDLEKIATTIYLPVEGEKPWESMENNVSIIGEIFDVKEKTDESLAKLEEKRVKLEKDAKESDQSSLTLMLNEGELSAYGEGSRFSILNGSFGFKVVDDKIESSTHGQGVSFEYVLEKNPDIMFVIDRTKAIGGDDSGNNLEDNPLIQETKAFKNKKIITLTPDVWYLSGGGLTSTDMMMEEAGKALN